MPQMIKPCPKSHHYTYIHSWATRLAGAAYWLSQDHGLRSYLPVCTKGSNFLFVRKWITHPEVNLHYRDFVWANSNMADRTGGQLESTVRVSNVGAKGFEPSTGWNNYIMSYTQSFQELSWGRLCKTALLLLPLSVGILISTNFRILNIYLHACDGPKTWYRTSIP